MRQKLTDVCREVVFDPVMAAREGMTFCNIALNRICLGVWGYPGFHDPKNEAILANDIHVKLNKDPDWHKDSPEKAQDHANEGKMAVAAWKNPQGHGHVAVVHPGMLFPSAKWKGRNAPLVANVGKHNDIDHANFFFVEEPEYFLYDRVPGSWV